MQTLALLASLPRYESARERPSEIAMAGHLLACKKLEYPTAKGRIERAVLLVRIMHVER